jgi:hypothetical protein
MSQIQTNCTQVKRDFNGLVSGVLCHFQQSHVRSLYLWHNLQYIYYLDVNEDHLHMSEVCICDITYNRLVLLLEETGVPRENHQAVTSHWRTLSHNVVLEILKEGI